MIGIAIFQFITMLFYQPFLVVSRIAIQRAKAAIAHRSIPYSLHFVDLRVALGADFLLPTFKQKVGFFQCAHYPHVPA